MITALLIGRKGSVGFPGKNTHKILGHPLAYYPLMAAKNAKLVDKIYMCTDCETLKSLAREHSVGIIERPEYLNTSKALGEDVFVFGYKEIVKRDSTQELIVLLHCNSATILPETIDQGITALKENKNFDSAVTVSKYNMWSPLRARKIVSDGSLQPFVPFDTFGNPKTLNCDRDSQGDVYFADMALSIVRPHCLDHIEEGLLPQKWMGQKIYPLIQEAGCDVDYEYQLAQTEYWLKKYNKEIQHECKIAQ
ncbi:MAG: cytidylyltransferase [Candidatus Omnitrophica bacterium]|nr:cytidylyltransferase [Candidatus Omnitrophota bacterium]